MSRKHFLIWGLGLIHLYILTGASGMYLAGSNITSYEITKDVFSVLYLFILVAFTVLLWKRFKQIGRKKRTLIWCALFYVIATVIGMSVLSLSNYFEFMIYETGFFDRSLASFKSTGAPSFLIKIELILRLLPAFYIVQWGLFALLWFGSRDPKAPLPFFGNMKSKRAAKRKIKHSASRNTGDFAHV